MAIKGLAGIKKYQEDQAAKAAERDRPKADWLSKVFPKETGDVVEVMFLQELDEDMENYDAEKGIGFIEVEHHAPGPDGYKRRATCTLVDGDCYACERHKADYSAGWKQRQSLYINVAVKHKDGTVKPYILTRNANSTFVQALIQEAIDEGSITNSVYRITRTGSGPQTQWIPKRLPKTVLFDLSGVEPFDISVTALRDIPYEKQPEWYGEVSSSSDDSASDSRDSGSSSADAEW